ncbi:FAD-dependent oxidoreductase, partial [Myxococcota bacterium]|nr:FAD-dependent oxidoreductase [Myxococcota bacterium]
MNHVRHQPRHVEYPQAPENNVSLPSNGKRVVIIGAGLTGLMLASELLDRGFKVTVLERSRISGGRLMAWDEPGFTCPAGVQLERALHGVWWSYRNLREFFGRRGIKLRTRWANAPEAVFSVVDPSGRVRAFKAARKLPSVLHAYGLKRCAERQAAEPFRLKLPQLMALMAFDSHDPEEVKALDAISMADWVRSHGIPEPFLNEFIDPLLRMCNFRSATESSALAWHRYTASHYGHWRDVEAVQFFDDITSEAIFEPLLASIRQRGGSVRFECPVAQLEVEAGRVAAALIAPQAAAWCPACGAAMAPDAPCAHCGFKGAPCVARLQEAPERITADAFISAVDLLGARAIFGEAPFAGQPFFDNLCQLPVSSPAIAYLWYPQPGATQTAWQARFGAREVLFSAGFKALGTTSNLTMIQPQRYSGGDL